MTELETLFQESTAREGKANTHELVNFLYLRTNPLSRVEEKVIEDWREKLDDEIVAARTEVGAWREIAMDAIAGLMMFNALEGPSTILEKAESLAKQTREKIG